MVTSPQNVQDILKNFPSFLRPSNNFPKVAPELVHVIIDKKRGVSRTIKTQAGLIDYTTCQVFVAHRTRLH